MKMSGFVRVPGLTFCAGVISIPAIFAGSYQIVTTVQTSTDVSLQAEAHAASNAEVRQGRKPVLVELITSQQCAACESAEQLLTHLDRDQPVQSASITVLSEQVSHSSPPAPVGYLSPTDPTRRQEDYQNLGESSQPAPLFIINGVVQDAHVGVSEIEQAIAAAPTSPVPLRLSSVRVRGNTVTFALDSGPATPGYVNVYAALVNSMVSTKVLGEQGVERTQTRSGVVRTFGRVGSSFRTKALGEHSFMIQDLAFDNRSGLDGMRLVVFVQTKHTGPVLGSTSCMLGRDMSATGEATKASSSAIPCPTLID
jgi:hypothetical protein